MRLPRFYQPDKVVGRAPAPRLSVVGTPRRLTRRTCGSNRSSRLACRGAPKAVEWPRFENEEVWALRNTPVVSLSRPRADVTARQITFTFERLPRNKCAE